MHSKYNSDPSTNSYNLHNLILKDSYVNSKLGDTLYFNVEYSQRKIIPEKIFKNWADNTNILQYLGVHYIDLVYFITGARPIRVLAMGQKNWLIKRGVNTYDSIQCFIEWEMIDGKRFNQPIIVNWIDPETSTAMSDQKFKLIGINFTFTLFACFLIALTILTKEVI